MQERGKFDGVKNIVKFNWTYYALSLFIISTLSISIYYYSVFWILVIPPIIVLIAATILSLFVSHWIYDRSDLYDLSWLDTLNMGEASKVVNLHAGFDETSEILKQKLHLDNLISINFYNSKAHTESSIARAQEPINAIPSLKLSTDDLQLDSQSIDLATIF